MPQRWSWVSDVRRVLSWRPLAWTLTGGLGLIMLLALRVKGHTLIQVSLLAWLLWLVPVAWLTFKDRFVRHEPSELDEAVPVDLLVATACFLLFLVSSAVFHRWFFFLNWQPSPESVWTKWPLWVLTMALATPWLIRPLRRPHAAVLGAVALMLLTVFVVFLRTTGGRALYRDDHPSMMFRLHEIALTYPQLLNYIPHWNAGVVHYAGAASGLTMLGVMATPILRFLPVHMVYTPLVGFVFILLIPIFAALAMRLLGATWSAAGLAALLAAGASRHYFLWFLHFGTVGACFASAMVLPVSACLYRILKSDRATWKTGAALIFFSMLLLAWPPAALMAAAVGASLLTVWSRWSRRKFIFLAICGVVLLALLTPQLRLTVADSQELLAFLLRSGRSTGEPGGMRLADSQLDMSLLLLGWNNLTAHLQEFHPAILFFGLGGLALSALRGYRAWFLPPLLILVILTGWGPVIKPNLQLGRMAIPLAILCIAPAALALERLWCTSHPGLAVFRSVIPALVLLTGWNLCSLWKGHGLAPYTVMTSKTLDLVDFIRQNTPANGRVMFAGASVHGYGDRGHIALLPLLAGREMMGCDYYHFSPSLVEYQYPPRPFRASAEGLWSFVESYNVNLILTRNARMAEAFRADPQRYSEIAAPDDVIAFVPQRSSSLFVKGDGEITAAFNRIVVRLSAPADEAVIKYAYVDGLRADPPAELFKYPVAEGFELIGFRPHGATNVTIRFHGRP